jgi:NitT/TauT family transport system ATP-binding protein
MPDAPNVVDFKGVTKRFGSTTVIRDVTFSVPDLEAKGEFIAILGPSGCGKSTVLRLIAGLPPHYPATEGTVLVTAKPVERPGPDRSMVFQDYTSFDNRTVEDNVAFGLECRGVAKAERRARARDWIAKVGLNVNRDRAQIPESAVGRHAAARGDRADADPLAADHPHGRAVRRPRSDHAPAHAGTAGQVVEGGRSHGILRHALDRGGRVSR